MKHMYMAIVDVSQFCLCYKHNLPLGAAIALWFCLRLPSSSPGFKSQARHLRFFNIYAEDRFLT